MVPCWLKRGHTEVNRTDASQRQTFILRDNSYLMKIIFSYQKTANPFPLSPFVHPQLQKQLSSHPTPAPSSRAQMPSLPWWPALTGTHPNQVPPCQDKFPPPPPAPGMETSLQVRPHCPEPPWATSAFSYIY